MLDSISSFVLIIIIMIMFMILNLLYNEAEQRELRAETAGPRSGKRPKRAGQPS